MGKEEILDLTEESPTKKVKNETQFSIVKDVDMSKCCIALSDHKSKKYKSTPTSVKVIYGKSSLRVCDYNHWNENYETIENNLNSFDKVSTSPQNSDIAEKCCNKICSKGKN